MAPIIVRNLAALMLNGPKVSRIAVGDLATGTWHSQELRQPIDGRAVPILSEGIAVYSLGQHVYAYGPNRSGGMSPFCPKGFERRRLSHQETPRSRRTAISIHLAERLVNGLTSTFAHPRWWCEGEKVITTQMYFNRSRSAGRKPTNRRVWLTKAPARSSILRGDGRRGISAGSRSLYSAALSF